MLSLTHNVRGQSANRAVKLKHAKVKVILMSIYCTINEGSEILRDAKSVHEPPSKSRLGYVSLKTDFNLFAPTWIPISD